MTVRLFKTALAILLLRAGPQDLPAGPQWLQLSVIWTLLTYVAAVSALFPVADALLRALLDLALSAAFVAALLQWRRKGSRFGQTFTAVCSTGALLNLIAWPLFLALAGQRAADGELARGEATGAVSLLLLLLYGWSLLISGHIYRHALDLRLATGVLLALGYFILAVWVGEALLGAESA